MQALLKAGANPALMNNKGLTVMHYAAAIDDPSLLQGLLEAGADPLALDGRDRTFQSILNGMNEAIATDSFVAGKRKIEAWLVEHGLSWNANLMVSKRMMPSEAVKAPGQGNRLKSVALIRVSRDRRAKHKAQVKA